MNFLQKVEALKVKLQKDTLNLGLTQSGVKVPPYREVRAFLKTLLKDKAKVSIYYRDDDDRAPGGITLGVELFPAHVIKDQRQGDSWVMRDAMTQQQSREWNHKVADRLEPIICQQLKQQFGFELIDKTQANIRTPVASYIFTIRKKVEALKVKLKRDAYNLQITDDGIPLPPLPPIERAIKGVLSKETKLVSLVYEGEQNLVLGEAIHLRLGLNPRRHLGASAWYDWLTEVEETLVPQLSKVLAPFGLVYGDMEGFSGSLHEVAVYYDLVKKVSAKTADLKVKLKRDAPNVGLMTLGDFLLKVFDLLRTRQSKSGAFPELFRKEPKLLKEAIAKGFIDAKILDRILVADSWYGDGPLTQKGLDFAEKSNYGVPYVQDEATYREEVERHGESLVQEASGFAANEYFRKPGNLRQREVLEGLKEIPTTPPQEHLWIKGRDLKAYLGTGDWLSTFHKDVYEEAVRRVKKRFPR